MATALRTFAAIMAGMLVAFVLLAAVELFGAVVHPTPPDFEGTMEEMCQHVANIPDWLLAVAVAAWGFTAFACTWTAQRIGSRGCAIFVGLLFLAAIVVNISMLPYPIWFKVVIAFVVPIASLLGIGVLKRRKAIGSNELT